MKITKLALALLLAGVGAGCAGVRTATPVALSDLPNCFDANYDGDRGLFTIRNDAGNPVNQQCLLAVGPRGGAASPQRLTAGSYRVYVANGGGGGAGGTLQAFLGGGGGGGGGAGSMESQATVYLAEGTYKLTIGAGGPGGTACMPGVGVGGGPGWIGSPSNMVRVATGEVLIGKPGADSYARPSRAQLEKMSGKADAHGGSGPGQTSGGKGAEAATKNHAKVAATSGEGKLTSAGSTAGGTTGTVSIADKSTGVGGGGGATSIGAGGEGGGESTGQKANPPERGSLGSGGGGGEGSMSECDPGARGGHGYVALRPN